MPETSIVIPVHNRLEFVSAALRSCLAQTADDLEVVVVDDGSTDPVEELLDRVRTSVGGATSVRYVRQSHGGGSAARNRGVQESSGAFIQFLDSDDLLHPSKVQIHRDRLRASPDADMVFSLDEYFGHIPGDTRLLWNAPDERPHLDRFLNDDPVWHTGSPLWRRAALEKVGPWDERLLCWQDWEFHARALCRGIRPLYAPGVLQYIREHGALRSTNSNAARERELSKRTAALAVADELKRASAANVARRKAISSFLAEIAENLLELNDAKEARTTLRSARAESSDLVDKTVCSALLAASFAPATIRRSRWDPVRIALRATRRVRFAWMQPSSWHVLPSESDSAPATLVELAAV